MGQLHRSLLVLLCGFAGLLFSANGLAADISGGDDTNPAAVRLPDYSFSEVKLESTVPADRLPVSLNHSPVNPAGIGYVLDHTFWDMQHIGAMGRQVTWGSDLACPWTMHASWTYLPSGPLVDREIHYNAWDGAAGADIGLYTDFQGPGDEGGFTTIDVTSDNRAVVTGNHDAGTTGTYRAWVWWQWACNTSFFSPDDFVPDGLAAIGNFFPPGSDDANVVWPKIAWQEPPDGDPVLHMLTCDFGTREGPGTLHYFQRIGSEAAGTWTASWPVDTIFNPEGYDLCASDEGTVAITWVANLVDPWDPACDTCSMNHTTGSRARDLWDNDLYFQINRNYGRGMPGAPYDGSTNWWENRINLTRNDDLEDGYRPFADMSSMITSDGRYHVAFVAMEWDNLDVGTYRSRIYHWSEDFGFGWDRALLRTVSTAQWDPEYCNPGPLKENQAKVSIAECDHKMYVLWAEYNSPHTLGNDNHDDCAARAFDAGYGYVGAANSDLFVSVSADGGFTWDPVRGLTDTYGGPTGNPDGACDLNGPAGPCPSEDWPSAAAYGTNFPVILPPAPMIAQIDPTYAGDHYLDLIYIDDPDPGPSVIGFGAPTESDVRWVRIPCTEPIESPLFIMTPDSSAHPDYVKHGVEEQIEVTIENYGNYELIFAEFIEEDPGPYSGWLDVEGFSGAIPPGDPNSETGRIIINKDGIVNAPGQVVHLTGRVEFAHNAPGPRAYFEVDVVVADTFPELGEGSWTVMVYLNGDNSGDNSLQTNAIEDLNEMERVFLSNDVAGPRGVDVPNEVNVIVQIDVYDIGYPDDVSDNTTRRYYVKYDGDDPNIGSIRLDTLPPLGEEDMGKWETLAEFACWGIDNYPADKYALILWDHGNGWYRDGEEDPDPLLKGVCWDDTDGSHIGVANEDLRKALDQIKLTLGGQKIDLLGFDACLMQMWEVMEVANSYARYMVGSEESEYADGWAYDGLLADLVESKVPLTAEEFGEAMCLAAVCDGAARPCDNQRTASCVKLSKIDELTLDMMVLSTGLIGTPADAARAKAVRTAMRTEGHEYQIYDKDKPDDKWHIDLYEFAERLSLDPEVTAGTKGVAEAVMETIEEAVTFNMYRADYAWSHGIAIYYPMPDYNPDYGLLPSSGMTDWDKFLKDNSSCCVNPGDANHDGSVDISDLTFFVDYMFGGGPAPPCMEEFDVDGNCNSDISDLTYYVDYLFGGGPAPVPCHTCP